MGIPVHYFSNLLLWEARGDMMMKSFSLWEDIPAHTDGSTVETSSMCEPYGKHTDSEESILQSARTCIGTGSKPGAGFVLTSVNAHRLFRCL